MVMMPSGIDFLMRCDCLCACGLLGFGSENNKNKKEQGQKTKQNPTPTNQMINHQCLKLTRRLSFEGLCMRSCSCTLPSLSYSSHLKKKPMHQHTRRDMEGLIQRASKHVFLLLTERYGPAIADKITQ